MSSVKRPEEEEEVVLVEEEQARGKKDTYPWDLHRLVQRPPVVDPRASQTLYTKEKGKEGL